MNHPKVSIITPVYNSSNYINSTINSVLSQTYTNWEWIIVDDLSKDNSVEIINEFVKKDKRIKLIRSKENLGSGLSRNIAIDNANGTFIAFLDSDDLWDANKLEIQINFMRQNNLAFSYSSYRYINEKGIEINQPYLVSTVAIDYNFLLRKTDIGCLTVVYNSEILGKRYMTDLKRKQDYALWLKILKDGYKAYPINNVLASYRVRKGSATSNKYKLIHLHYLFLRKTQNLNILLSIYFTFLWGISGFKKFFYSRLKF